VSRARSSGKPVITYALCRDLYYAFLRADQETYFSRTIEPDRQLIWIIAISAHHGLASEARSRVSPHSCLFAACRAVGFAEADPFVVEFLICLSEHCRSLC
jgi:hypothetical protein